MSAPARDDLADIMRYYEGNAEAERCLRQRLEYCITQCLLAHYLPKSAHILELGAGAGNYTLELAERGHRVTAVEPVPSLAGTLRRRAAEQGLGSRVSVCPVDARDLAGVEGPFDAALVMGPLYHLQSADERRLLLTEVRRRLAPGGIVLAGYLTRIGFVARVMYQQAGGIGQLRGGLEAMIRDGFDPNHPRDGTFRGYFCHPEEIAPELASAGLEPRAIHCQDPAIGAVDEIFNLQAPELQRQWLEILLPLTAHPSSWGSGRSLLAVASVPR